MVAIPAVIAFNFFQGQVRKTLARVDAIAHLVLATFSETNGAARRRRHPCAPRRRASAMAGGAGGYGNDDDSGRMIVDINVTPLVDITLVLLIIFMVTASLHRQPGDQGRPAQGGVRHRADQDHPGADARQGRRAVPQRPAQQRRGGGRATSAPSSPRTRSCRRSSPPTRPCPTATSSTSSIWSSARACTSSRSAPTGNRPAGSAACRPPEKVFRTCGHPAAAARAPPACGAAIAVGLARPARARGREDRSGAVPRRGADRDRRRGEAAAPRGEAAAAARGQAAARAPARRPSHSGQHAAAADPAAAQRGAARRPTSRRRTSACR